MAQKRPPPIEEPPAASSSSEEASSGEEEEESSSSSSSEEEEQQPQKPSPPPHQKSTRQNPESESESGSESESDEDAFEAIKTKPIASKSMDETPPTKKPRSKPPAAAAEKLEEKKQFQRVWTEEDEIAVLEGIIEFKENKGMDYSKDMNAFFEFIKKSLSFDATIGQLKEKIGRLKRKFDKLVKKNSKMGEDLSFTKPHEQQVFDLWKKIWGSDGINGFGGAGSSGKCNRNVKSKNAKSLAALKVKLGMVASNDNEREDEKMGVDEGTNLDLKLQMLDGKSIGVAGMKDFVINKGLEAVKGEKKAEMEEKWRKLHVDELELFLKRQQLIVEQAKLMLASYKSEDED